MAAVAAAAAGRRFGFGVAGAGLLVLLAAVAVYVWGIHRPSRASAAPDAPVTLAILPIANRTGDASMDALVDGLTEDLIRQMSDVPHLKVISQTAVFGYRGQTVDVRTVGQALHVNSVMTSSIRRSGSSTVMDVELSNVSDGSVVLSRQYLPEESDMRPVRAEIVQDLFAGLHLGRPDQPFSTTSNSVAYQDYLAGEGYLRRISPGELHRAIPLLEQAVMLDPKFASAWGELAEAHLMLGIYFELPYEHIPEARHDLEEALKLEPERPEFHGALGLIHLVYDWNYPAAASELSSDGREESAFHLLSCSIHLMHQAGEANRAEETLRRLEEQSPGASTVISELGCVSYYRRKYPDAVAYYRRALDYDPGSPIPYWGMGKSLAQENRFDEAVKAMQQFEAKNGFEPPMLTAEMGYALGRAGKLAEAKQKIAKLQADAHEGFVDPYLVAVVYLGMGDRKAAFEWLEKAYTVRSSFMISIVSDPKWDAANTDPRFTAIVRRMNLYQTS